MQAATRAFCWTRPSVDDPKSNTPDELTIAASTVGVHVHRILAKLGLRSRWQIADWTMAHDPEQLRAAES